MTQITHITTHMQPSPIQLKEMYFLGITVWPRLLEDDETDKQPETPFDFNGVRIGESIAAHTFKDQNDQLSYGITLRITIKNESGKKSPYTIDVEASGLFEIINKNIPDEKREEMAIVNGCAILYSAIREQVMTLSSRCVRGTFMLPTVNFHDKIKVANSDAEQSEQPSKPKTKKKPNKTN